ncbi:DUF4340 domain-containing protein [Gracilibacillus sp. S3-1-1]|uniref:DUF4340 domain-containing protein n=1 Tax=Gracilibacillus pellucidus TaxID=3095368 RepID=A0ACC6M0V3_9BACI|nr:DUF4340 domain-containing protein [Gracilibacillus sp. S3-1-1]MDX8044561.1 DUF4340 domain-containing protein [Gracilibacillus sp. S3-1-1]
MKNKKNVIYIVSSVVILSAFLMVIVQLNQHSVAKDDQVETVIEHFETVTSVKVNAKEKVSLMKQEDGWHVEGVDRSEDATKINHFLSAMKDMTGDQVSVEKKNVQLNFPKVVVSFSDMDGSVQRLAIGAMDQQGENYYVEHKDNEIIYAVDRAFIESIPLQSHALVDNSILSMPSSAITEIEIDNGTEIIQLRKDSPFSEVESLAHVSGWYVYQPFRSAYSVNFSHAQDILLGIDQLEQVEQVKEPGDYGLENVDFSITFSDGEREERLNIGDPAVNNMYYVQLENSEEIYKILAERLNPFSHRAYEMIDHFVHILSLDVVDQLTIVTKETQVTYTFKHDDDGEEIVTSVFLDGEKQDTENFRNEYKKIAGLSFDRTYDGEIVEEEPEVSIVYQLTDENGQSIENKIDFLNISDKEVAIRKDNNERIDFIMKKEKLDQVIEWALRR